MKAVAYYRVSTTAQGRSGLGLDAQGAAVAELARQRGLTLISEFTEVESGKRNDRPVLAQALRYARVSNATLVIAKLDRLSRNAAFLLALRDSGTQFVAADVPDANNITVGILAVLAQAEREAISKRTTDALREIKSKLAAGRPHVSSRSGRPVERLGNPRGILALGRCAGNLAAANRARLAAAAERRAALHLVISEARLGGEMGLSGIAAELNRRGIPAQRGGLWYPSTVKRLLDPAGSTKLRREV